MMDIPYLLYLLAIYVSLHVKDLHASEAEKRLVNHLFNENNHNKLIRPVENSSEALNVSVTLAIYNLADIEWNDYQLKWDPAKFGGINYINIRPDHVWLPDLVLYNNAHDDNAEYGGNMDTLKTRIKVIHTGDMLWAAPLFLKAKCSIKVDDFPFDTQMCYLKIGSWTYPVTAVNLMTKGVDASAFQTSEEWNLKKVGSKYNIEAYQCCPGSLYPDIDFELTFERKSLFYATNLIFPMVLITVLTILTFILPNESGERIGLAVTMMLAVTVFMLMVAETTPDSSEGLPILVHYFIFCLLIIFAIIVLLCCISRLYNRGRTEKPMSKWIRRWILDYLSYKLHIRHRTNGNNLAVPISIEKKPTDENKEECKMTWNRDGEAAMRKRKTSSVSSTGSGQEDVRLYGDQDNSSLTMEEEWRVVAMTIDYMLFIGFVIIFLLGTAATFGGVKYVKSVVYKLTN